MNVISTVATVLSHQPVVGPALSSLKSVSQSCVSRLEVLARQLVLSRLPDLQVGCIVIHEADGNTITVGKPAAKTKKASPEKKPNGTHRRDPAAHLATAGELTVHSPAFWLRLLLAGDVGFGEAYMAGEVTSPDLTAVLSILARPENHAASTPWTRSTAYHAAGLLLAPLGRRLNDVATARLNAVAHYSTSNAVFAAMLDPTMTYSCPVWADPDPAEDAEPLEDAQRRKLRLIVRLLRLSASDRVLEIGGGWGSFALLAAAETGCHVTTITPSGAQCEAIRARAAAAGLSANVEVLQVDYRELPASLERFDKIVSIEMLEHVGRAFFADYFAVVDRWLRPGAGAVAVFQSITIGEPAYEAYVRKDDFIKKHVFPGGELPCVSSLVDGIWRGAKGRLVVEEVRSQGLHYAKALRAWRRGLDDNWDAAIVPELRRINPGISDRDLATFRNKWAYYYSYCEAGFLTKCLGDVIIVVGRDGTLEFLDV